MFFTPFGLQCPLAALLERQVLDGFTVGTTDLAKVIGGPFGLRLPENGCDGLVFFISPNMARYSAAERSWVFWAWAARLAHHEPHRWHWMLSGRVFRTPMVPQLNRSVRSGSLVSPRSSAIEDTIRLSRSERRVPEALTSSAGATG